MAQIAVATLHVSGDTALRIHRTMKNALPLPRLNLAPPPVPANLLVVLLNVAPYKNAEVAWLAVADCFNDPQSRQYAKKCGQLLLICIFPRR